MSWYFSICYLRCINYTSIFIFPCNGIFIYLTCICCLICCISCCTCYSRTPSCKGICILCSSWLTWICMCWYSSMSYLCCINYVSIVIFPCNRIFSRFACICSCICCISSYTCQLWTPSSKGICILCRSWLIWICMCWNSSIINLCCIDGISAIIFPCDCSYIFMKFYSS